MHILTVTLNPCIDAHYEVERYAHGGLNRVRQTRSDIAGKGINVAAVLKNLGLDPICTGFNFAENGGQMTAHLNSQGIKHDFVTVSGAIRTNIKLHEKSTAITTELNQPGALVPEQAQTELLEKIKNHNPEGGILILSGSRPQGVAPDFYARLSEAWGGKVFLDTEGEALLAALNCKNPPHAIKPNLFELQTAYNTTIKTPQQIIEFCRANISTPIICVSMGADGAVLITPQAAYQSPAIKTTPKSTAGAGDSMLAAIAHAVANNLPAKDYLPRAIAAATATISLEGTQMCTLDGFTENLKKV